MYNSALQFVFLFQHCKEIYYETDIQTNSYSS
jgi:hypothetical protein